MTAEARLGATGLSAMRWTGAALLALSVTLSSTQARAQHDSGRNEDPFDGAADDTADLDGRDDGPGLAAGDHRDESDDSPQGGLDDEAGDGGFGDHDTAMAEGEPTADSLAQDPSAGTATEGSDELLFAAPEDDAGDIGAAEGTQTPNRPTRTVRIDIAAGAGFGTLRMNRPLGTGHEVLDETPFAAMEAALTLHIVPDEVWSWDIILNYQTSLGLKVQVEPLFGLPEQIHVRWQHLEMDVAPVLRLSDSGHGPTLALPIGFAVQTLTPIEHQYDLQQLVVGGPNLRLEFRAPLGERVSLRLGAEVRWLALINSELTDEGAGNQGLGAGGQAALNAHIGPALYAGLAYREFFGFAPANAARFRSRERVLTARLGGEL